MAGDGPLRDRVGTVERRPNVWRWPCLLLPSGLLEEVSWWAGSIEVHLPWVKKSGKEDSQIQRRQDLSYSSLGPF